jgi:hypothetical protein
VDPGPEGRHRRGGMPLDDNVGGLHNRPFRVCSSSATSLCGLERWPIALV